jgi:hypothetical protein
VSSLKSDVGPLAVVPLRLLVAAGVSDRAVRLFGLLSAKYCDRDGICWPSRKTLAADLGVSTDSVDRALAELTSAGFVAVSRRRLPSGDLTSNRYQLRYAAAEKANVLAAGLTRTPSRTRAATPGGRATAATPSRTAAATRTSHSSESGTSPHSPPERGASSRPLTRAERLAAEQDLKAFRDLQPGPYMGPQHARPATFVEPHRHRPTEHPACAQAAERTDTGTFGCIGLIRRVGKVAAGVPGICQSHAGGRRAEIAQFPERL